LDVVLKEMSKESSDAIVMLRDQLRESCEMEKNTQLTVVKFNHLQVLLKRLDENKALVMKVEEQLDNENIPESKKARLERTMLDAFDTVNELKVDIRRLKEELASLDNNGKVF
jgi:hypothetical protein